MITQVKCLLLLCAAATAVMTTSYPARLDASETTDASISGPGWRCDLQQRRLLGEHAKLGRHVARLARNATGCRVIADRFELCEPVYLRESGSTVEDFTAGEEAVRNKRLCAALDCNEEGVESAKQVLALDDAFGRRSVTTGALDRFCIDVD
jgi:hypothetical protein